jgi:hypothetical protein
VTVKALTERKALPKLMRKGGASKRKPAKTTRTNTQREDEGERPIEIWSAHLNKLPSSTHQNPPKVKPVMMMQGRGKRCC